MSHSVAFGAGLYVWLLHNNRAQISLIKVAANELRELL